MEKWTIKNPGQTLQKGTFFMCGLWWRLVGAHVSTISGAQAHSLLLRMTAWTHQVAQQYPRSSRTLPQIFRCCSNCFPHLSGSHWNIESNARQKGVAPLSWISPKKKLNVNPPLMNWHPKPHHFGTVPNGEKTADSLNPQSALGIVWGILGQVGP